MDNTRKGFKLTPTDKDKRIAELEKENAELKDLIEMKLKDGTSLLNAMIMKNLADQLTKAKEIIKELLNSCFGYNSKTVNYEVKAKAEQFLKEE